MNKMEQVVAMNNFDKLIGRNGELVEERKKQVLAGALEIVQRYYADKQNKMEVVAKLFGKKLCETFGVFKDECGFAYVKFTEDGLRMVHSNGKVFTRNDIEDFGFSVDLEDLITGSAVIINEV